MRQGLTDRRFGAWSDAALQNGYRLQRHVGTEVGRIIDPRGRQVARGNVAELDARLLELVAEEPPLDTVLLLHGLTQSRHVFDPLLPDVAGEGRVVLAPTYASTRGGLNDHALTMAGLIARLSGKRRVVLVGHSLGGLMVRRLLAPDIEPALRHRVVGAVLVTTPNRGSKLAETFVRVRPLRRLFGPALLDCCPGRARRLGPMPVPFCTIEAGSGGPFGFNPLLGFDNDAVVRVDEMRLEGAAAVHHVRAPHGGIFFFPAVRRRVGAFIDRLLATDDPCSRRDISCSR